MDHVSIIYHYFLASTCLSRPSDSSLRHFSRGDDREHYSFRVKITETEPEGQNQMVHIYFHEEGEGQFRYDGFQVLDIEKDKESKKLESA